MVEMQKWFMKFAKQKGLRPMRVREASASYIANTASRGMRESGGMPLLRSLGNRELLHRKWISFFCSIRCPGHLLWKAYDLAQRWRAENQPVIGGFHSPVEKEVLNIMLRSTVPVCIVLARSLPKRIPKEFCRPLDEDRLLLVSPFDEKTRRATQETAAYRNQVVAALADKVFLAYAAPGSKTEAFCREVVGTGKPCMTFDDPKTVNLKAAGFASFSL
jgi:predicted Rossmann fold nucleotide-binding protein DprA/Smf involved in DNA uptake